MLTTWTKDTVCFGDTKNFSEVVSTLATEGDKFIDRFTQEDVISKTVQYLNDLYPATKGISVDNMALFIGNTHAHLVAFFRGCNTYVINMDLFNLYDIMQVLK